MAKRKNYTPDDKISDYNIIRNSEPGRNCKGFKKTMKPLQLENRTYLKMQKNYCYVLTLMSSKSIQ